MGNMYEAGGSAASAPRQSGARQVGDSRQVSKTLKIRATEEAHR